jgi:carbon-monoxide dehydrogenase catalytic subunit
MSEKAISIGHYFVASGVYTCSACTCPGIRCAPVFQKLPVRRDGKMYGGMWDLEADPIKHAQR